MITNFFCVMVFLIFIGASLFSLVFRGFGGDEQVREFLDTLPGGVFTSGDDEALFMYQSGAPNYNQIHAELIGPADTGRSDALCCGTITYRSFRLP